mgnify:CR=1 FL=1
MPPVQYPCTGGISVKDGINMKNSLLIRCVGDPRERFTEDALRIMRCIRFAAQLGFTIDAETYAAARELAPTLRLISVERVREELLKTLIRRERASSELVNRAPHPKEFELYYDL